MTDDDSWFWKMCTGIDSKDRKLFDEGFDEMLNKLVKRAESNTNGVNSEFKEPEIAEDPALEAERNQLRDECIHKMQVTDELDVILEAAVDFLRLYGAYDDLLIMNLLCNITSHWLGNREKPQIHKRMHILIKSLQKLEQLLIKPPNSREPVRIELKG
jgi:hypothetical protein